ncbi:hypothetical protein BSL84_30470 [Streptomyces sp. TN58]|nr:hypothetical protein BSL84_30470 [Streptomyces sp. TN58]
MPPLTHIRFGERAQDPLTAWEASVIASYQIAFNPTAGTAALLVPHVVAEQLTATASSSMPIQPLNAHGNAATAEYLLAQWLPGDPPEHPASGTMASRPARDVQTQHRQR